MYMRPILPGVGALCATHACTHSIAFASIHIGSGPGVAGLSGMQVKPFVPLRIVRILPSASIATIVAFLLTAAGAALIALLISSASVGPAFAFDAVAAVSAWANIVKLNDATPSIRFALVIRARIVHPP